MKCYLLMAAIGLIPCQSWAECQLIASQQKIVYTRLSPAERQQATGPWITLPEKQIQVQVNCSEPQRIRLFFGSDLPHNGTFSLGSEGEMLITAARAQVDDRPVRIASVNRSDTVLRSAGSETLQILLNEGLAFSNGDEVYGKNASVSLLVAARVKPGPVTEQTTWRGNLNIKMEVQ